MSNASELEPPHTLDEVSSQQPARGKAEARSDSKKVWIDLDNSPHVPFFAPIIEELKNRGYLITVTVRDAYQTCELADFHQLHYQRIGRHYGRHRVMKVFGTCLRALQLRGALARQRPALAMAHGSRA